MIEWIKTVFKNRPDTSTPITALWLNDLQDWISSIQSIVKENALKLGLIKDYVIDYDENSSGKWEKWASGKLVQWGTIKANQNINQSYGSLFRSSANMRHTFNVEFVGAIPTLIISANTNSCFGAYLNDVSQLSFGWRPLHVFSQSVDVEISWEAIGKWK